MFKFLSLFITPLIFRLRSKLVPYKPNITFTSIMNVKLYGMDVPTLISFMRQILSVFFSKNGETGDIYFRFFGFYLFGRPGSV